MKTITITLDAQLAVMLRDAAIWFTDDQRQRRKGLPPDFDPSMMRLAEKFDAMRLEAANIIDEALKR